MTENHSLTELVHNRTPLLHLCHQAKTRWFLLGGNKFQAFLSTWKGYEHFVCGAGLLRCLQIYLPVLFEQERKDEDCTLIMSSIRDILKTLSKVMLSFPKRSCKGKLKICFCANNTKCHFKVLLLCILLLHQKQISKRGKTDINRTDPRCSFER